MSKPSTWTEAECSLETSLGHNLYFPLVLERITLETLFSFPFQSTTRKGGGEREKNAGRFLPSSSANVGDPSHWRVRLHGGMDKITTQLLDQPMLIIQSGFFIYPP